MEENYRRYGIPVESYFGQRLQTLPGVTAEVVIASLTRARIAEVRRSKPPLSENRQRGRVYAAYVTSA